MKVLIVGGSSLLGKYLAETSTVNIEKTWFTNFVYGASHLDIASPSQVNYTFARITPDIVIHCAAIGSVDYAESHFAETHMINVLGTRNVIAACRLFQSKLIYISTNAVFDGKQPPYTELHNRQPINAYGVIKKEAEDNVITSGIPWMIIRPFLLYGWPYPQGRQNWMTKILTALIQHEKVNLVNDTYWQPTSAADCARVIWQLLNLDKWSEVYHVASDDKISLYDFGLKVAQVFEKDASLIAPISSASLSITTRPKDTSFDLSKIHNLDIRLKSVEDGLQEMKEEFE